MNYGYPPYEPPWYADYNLCTTCYQEPCICPPVDIDADAYLAWWEEEVAAGRIAAPEYEGATP